MKNKIHIIIFSIFLYQNCYAQNTIDTTSYRVLSEKAKELQNNKKYNKALKIYLKLFELKEKNKSNLYIDASLCAYQIKDLNLTKKLLTYSISKGGISANYLDTNNDLGIMKHEQFWKETISNYNSYKCLYYSKYSNNIDAYIEVQELFFRDQFVRFLPDYILGITDEDRSLAYPAYFKALREKDSINIKKYEPIVYPKIDTAVKKIQLKLIEKIDSLNISRLIEITKKYGWQPNGYFILWHQRNSYGSNNYVWNYFKPFLSEEIDKGNLDKSFFAAFEDFKSLKEIGVTMYGVLQGKVPENVNQNRCKVGLDPLTMDEILMKNNN